MVWWILGLSAAYAVALNGTIVMPLVVLSISKLSGYDEGLATIVASAELAGIGLYGLFLPRLARRSRKAVAFAGVLAVLASEAASVYLHAPAALAGARLVTGLGEGAIFSAVTMSLASLADAERLWGALSLIGGTAMGALLLAVSLLPENQIGASVFWMLAGFAAVLAPLFLLIDKHSMKLATAPLQSRLPRTKVFQAMIIVFLVYAVQAAQWALCGYVGERLHMNNGAVGLYLAASSLIGFLGALVPSVTRDKAKRLPAVLIGLLIMAASIYCFFNFFTPLVFVTAQVLVNIGFFIATPFITGILTENDPDGSLMSRTLVVAIVGAAIGTAVAGPIFESAGAAIFGWSCLLPLAVAAIFVYVVFGHLHRGLGLVPDARSVAQKI